MSRKKRNRDQKRTVKLLLITALLELITALIELIRKLLE